jgi:hypothetical protein
MPGVLFSLAFPGFFIAISEAASIRGSDRMSNQHQGQEQVVVVAFSDDGNNLGRETVPRIKDDPDWKRMLSPLSYEVTREHGTERPFSIPGYDRTDAGIYRCICCNTALFRSDTKFDGQASGLRSPKKTSFFMKTEAME